MEIKSLLKKLKLLVIDVDGVLTDGKLYYTEEGESFKIFDVKDGLGIKLLCKKMNVVFLSGNPSEIIQVRAKALGVSHCFTGIEDKKKILLFLMNKLDISKKEIAYIGDDLNDLVVRPLVGLFVCPFDAHPSVKKIADATLKCKGGNGAVREFVDRVLNAKGVLNDYSTEGIIESNV
ncbi:KdsC family phosphatase [Leptospira alstonii]|uniref:KdsC family phosphatase n=1 Tax=Leptospira alstonii TaxID=28452 RepID=UPI000774C684|nr:HAD-IIIA family hydrolase [Leptospira alstonii]